MRYSPNLLMYPLKAPKLTDRLIFSIPQKNSGYTLHRMFDCKSGELLGIMRTKTQTINTKYLQGYEDEILPYTSLYIKELRAFKKGEGIGTAFINFAKKLSMKNFCSGNLHVISFNMWDIKDIPHAFYRKMGFQFPTYSLGIQKYIDKCIQTKTRPVLSKECPEESIMYYTNCIKDQAKNIDILYKFKIKFPALFELL